jgi:HK97 family phage prohead protease
MDRLSCGFEIKFAAGAAEGTFSGYGSVTGVTDLGDDLIASGAFERTLREWNAKGKLPKMLLQHGSMASFFGGGAEDNVPIGKWTSMSEDSKGLYCEGRLIALDTDRGKSVYAAMKEGELDGLSIGYRVKEYTLGTKPDEPYRTIKDLDLLEVSVVLFGMNPQALVTNVKSLSDAIDGIENLSDAESFLRDAGQVSRKTATAFVSRVAGLVQRDARGEGGNARAPEARGKHPRLAKL